MKQGNEIVGSCVFVQFTYSLLTMACLVFTASLVIVLLVFFFFNYNYPGIGGNCSNAVVGEQFHGVHFGIVHVLLDRSVGEK